MKHTLSFYWRIILTVFLTLASNTNPIHAEESLKKSTNLIDKNPLHIGDCEKIKKLPKNAKIFSSIEVQMTDEIRCANGGIFMITLKKPVKFYNISLPVGCFLAFDQLDEDSGLALRTISCKKGKSFHIGNFEFEGSATFDFGLDVCTATLAKPTTVRGFTIPRGTKLAIRPKLEIAYIELNEPVKYKGKTFKDVVLFDEPEIVPGVVHPDESPMWCE